MTLSSSAFNPTPPVQIRPDPRLEIRIAVRHGMESVRTGRLDFRSLEEALEEFPSLVEATIERERILDPQAVGALRMALGLELNPWDLRAKEAIRIYENTRAPSDRARFAAGLLQGETVCLPALALAVCRNPKGLPLLVAKPTPRMM